MIIFRYLAKEVFLTLVSLTAVLLLIFLSNQFVQYLNRAASGNIPGVIIMKLMMLELPNLLVLLLPLGFYIALLLAYGRLYAENEMTVLQSCGFGPQRLLGHSILMACGVALMVLVIVIWGSPLIAKERTKLIHAAGIQTLIQTIMPGRFQSFGNKVFYVQTMSRDHSKAQGVFLAQRSGLGNQVAWDVLRAEKAFAQKDAKTGEDYLVLRQGKLYQGVPGQAQYQVAEFEKYTARLPHPRISTAQDIRTAMTSTLWPLNNTDRSKAAELQWRISIPLMVFTLTLIAVPLSRINPRSGKFSKLLPAVIIYILYANGMFVARDAVSSGKLPVWLGMWWLHGLALCLGLFLLWRNQVKLA